jgi:hypothetical protein
VGFNLAKETVDLKNASNLEIVSLMDNSVDFFQAIIERSASDPALD